jgi:hypothetical protein
VNDRHVYRNMARLGLTEALDLGRERTAHDGETLFVCWHAGDF